ncbi:hypothetical protein [Actinosynnema sp. NPDC020468]|uniref:hypothetical protein n=1 Tax=Actinosynnema sp. NPDC020468 TaxID=3154488 RepID=UPI0033EA8830
MSVMTFDLSGIRGAGSLAGSPATRWYSVEVFIEVVEELITGPVFPRRISELALQLFRHRHSVRYVVEDLAAIGHLEVVTGPVRCDGKPSWKAYRMTPDGRDRYWPEVVAWRAR